MTAFSLSEKPSAQVVNQSCEADNASRLPCQGRHTLLAVVTILLISAVAFTITGGLLIQFSRVKDHQKSKEWIYWTRTDGNIIIHESGELDQNEQTALMISAEAHKINYDNSIALHDFNMGYVALRDFNAGRCFVTNIKFTDFNQVKEDIKGRQGKTLPIQPVKRKVALPNIMTSSDLGQRLTEFCKGIPSHWIHDAGNSDTHTAKRQVLDPPIGTACYFERWEFEV